MKLLDIFKKRNWGKWQHINFVEEFTAGNSVYELLRRECLDTGDIQWKRVKVKDCVHHLCALLNSLFKDKQSKAE